MSYLDHDGLAYFKSKLDRTFIADIVFDDGDILLYGGDGTLLKTVVQEGTVTQKKSVTNKEYPILLCWDADAEEDQTMKTVWYGLDARINPKFGYLYARRYYTEHPSYERTSVPSTRAEWHHMFTDAVSAPMGEVYEYLDRNSDGGEHRMELRLYGNPLSQYVDTPNHNEATDAVSIGVGATRGDTLTFFGYCPSTPIYLENGSTMRKSTVRGDQYGKDIITRDWLNLNGSITGLVHTYMDETIDGYKTFLKTVTINSGDNNNKAGLYVQGDANLHSNAHVYGNEVVDGTLTANGKFTANGTAEIKGGSGSTPSLTVTGNEYISGNSNVHGSLDVDTNLNVDGTSNLHGAVTAGNGLAVTGNETVSGTLTVGGKITGNGGAEISGGSGLKVNGNETVTGNLTVGGTTTTEDLTVTDDATIGDDLTVNGDELVKGNETVNGNSNVGGTINKVSGNTTQEYVTYVTNQADTRKNIAAGLVDTTKGLAYNPTTGKIYVNANTNKGIGFDSNGKLYVDFSQIDENTKAAILDGLDVQIPLKTNKTIYVDNAPNVGATDSFSLDFDTRISTKFATIQKAVEWASSKLALGTKKVFIKIQGGSTSSPREYNESVNLPEVNASSGYIDIDTVSGNKDVKIRPLARSDGFIPSCMIAGSGSCYWRISHIIFDLEYGCTSTTGQVSSCISASVNGARIDLYGCDYYARPELVSDSRRTTITGEAYDVRMINADNGGVIYLNGDPKGSKAVFTLPATNTAGMNINVINVSRDGRAYYRRNKNTSEVDDTVFASCYVQGSCTNFFTAWQSGGTNRLGSGVLFGFPVASGQSVTGVPYSVTGGSYTLGPSGGYPGDGTPVVEANTYCWVSGA